MSVSTCSLQLGKARQPVRDSLLCIAEGWQGPERSALGVSKVDLKVVLEGKTQRGAAKTSEQPMGSDQAGQDGCGSCTSDASRAKNHCESHLSMSAWSWKGLLCFSSISWTRAISPAASICFCLFLIISSAARACGAPRSRHCLRLSSSVCHLPRLPLVPDHWNTNEKVLLEVLSCHMLHGRNANL